MKPGIGVGVMVIKENQILLGLRNPDKVKTSSEIQGQGTWTMPGGKVEFMEKLVDAAKRELEEETILEWKWFDFNNLPENLYKPSAICIQKYKKGIIYE